MHEVDQPGKRTSESGGKTQEKEMKALQYIIRILAKKWLLLLVLPVMAAAVVFAVMSRQPKLYKSSCTIYTGIVSGYDVLASENSRLDWMAVNNAVDNLMSVIMA